MDYCEYCKTENDGSIRYSYEYGMWLCSRCVHLIKTKNETRKIDHLYS